MLADGSKLAAERMGKGSEKFAMHMGGQDIPARHPRVSVGYGWGYFCDPTPARHTSSLVKQAHDFKVPFATSTELKLPETGPYDVTANAPIYATC